MSEHLMYLQAVLGISDCYNTSNTLWKPMNIKASAVLIIHAHALLKRMQEQLTV